MHSFARENFFKKSVVINFLLCYDKCTEYKNINADLTARRGERGVQ